MRARCILWCLLGSFLERERENSNEGAGVSPGSGQFASDALGQVPGSLCTMSQSASRKSFQFSKVFQTCVGPLGQGCARAGAVGSRSGGLGVRPPFSCLSPAQGALLPALGARSVGGFSPARLCREAPPARSAAMPRAALPALLLPLLCLAAAAVADCPSSSWVQFQDSCYLFLQEAINVESIEDIRNQCTAYGADMVSIHNEAENAFILETLKNQWKGPDDLLLGMFFDTDDASFKWFDKSNVTFDKWTDQDNEEDLIDTCAFLHTKTGEWKKGNCEVSSVEGTLCKTAIPYETKYLSDNHILVSALVIGSTVILTVLGAIVWFLYKRNLDSGFTTVFSSAPQSPYDDDCVLVIAEENEYAVQFD